MRGTDNTEADVLSLSSIVNHIDIEELGQQHGEIPNGKFTTENGIHIVRKRGLRKVYVPPSLREKTNRSAHDCYGQAGVKKALQLLSPQYYWPDIIIDVSNFIKHWETCQMCTKLKVRKYGQFEFLPSAEKPFDLLSHGHDRRATVPQYSSFIPPPIMQPILCGPFPTSTRQRTRAYHVYNKNTEDVPLRPWDWLYGEQIQALPKKTTIFTSASFTLNAYNDNEMNE